MGIGRRDFLQFAAAAAAAASPLSPKAAAALDYPSRPVRVINGFPAGTTADTFSRLMTEWLSQQLGQPFIVENRPGAGTNIAAASVVTAQADGYTLLWVTAANATAATAYEKLSFDFIRDIAPVAGVDRTTFILVIHPSVPAKTVPEFIAYAKANPGKINIASGGYGTAIHLVGELFKMMTGVDIVYVHYHGDAPALTDLVAGRVQAMFSGAVAVELVKAGKLRALGVTTASRLEQLPDVPSIGDFVAGYEASGWQGLGAPRKTPAAIVERLNKTINAGLADAKIRARYAELGGAVIPGSAGDFGKLIAAETEKWGKVIKFAGIKAE
ncbi:MAG TPA: tripartite tricarboxylate transporter substrate binding protein [Xanthobacteraceae bacterium]|nr:tripartite tricarboxylate transporter substrate binding protein [Xanthobacteraceae bacterium]